MDERERISLFDRALSRRSFLGVSAGALVGTFLAACGGGSSESGGSTTAEAATGAAGSGSTGEKVTVAFLYDSFGRPRFLKGDVPGFEAEAKKLGIEAIVQGTNNDEAKQAAQVDQVLTRGIRALVISAVNIDSAPTLVERAQDAGVPVISYNVLIRDAPVAGYIARDSIDVGRELATAALEAVPEGNYVLVLGDQANDVGRGKADGKMEILQPAIDSGAIKIVSQQWTTGWAPDLAQKQVEQALTANDNNIQAVLASNDGMALGALEALKAQGLEKSVFITGEDAEPAFVEALESGVKGASNFTPFEEMGRIGARVAAAVARGETIPNDGTVDNGAGEVPWYKVKTFNVTSENVQQFVKDYPWWIDENA